MIHHSDLKFKGTMTPRGASGTKYIVLHHSGVSSRHSVRDVHNWHLHKGWAGIGYHYFITKDGEIYEGRNRNHVGAHAYGYNNVSIGVCFEGNFNKETVSLRQEEASVMLLALLSLSYQAACIVRHSELIKTKNCPGKNFPFERILRKVNDCKKYLSSLLGQHPAALTPRQPE